MKYKESLKSLIAEHRGKFITEFIKFLQDNEVAIEEESWTYDEFNVLVNTYKFEGANSAVNYLKSRRGLNNE